MPVSQLPQAPYRQDRRVYPTPIIGDVLFSEVRDCTRIEIPEYGTPHPNSAKWPDHKLVFVKTVDIERDGIFEFFYAAERENQDLYNFAFGNRVIGNREFRTVTRTYVTLRDNFKPVDIEFGTPMPDTPEDKFDGVSYVFYDKEQQNTQQEELNSLFVIEARSYVEAAVLDEQLSLSVEKQDPLPPKFRVLSPTTTTEELAEGEVTTPTLTGDQLAATEDQINTNLKRKRTVKRSSAENIGSLSGKQVTNVLQVADVVETIVPDGTTIVASALTVDGSVEPLGNGQSLQRVITAPELFKAESYSTERPDLVPEKFRAIAPTTTEESSVVGTAAKPVLSTGELAATEQQQNKFVKRTRKTKRDLTTLPKSLTQKTTNNEKQTATVVETLQIGDTTINADAFTDVESQALGDGTYVVRTVSVPEVFGAESYSIEKPDLVPEKFRPTIPIRTEESNIVGWANRPSLSGGELAATEQQQNSFVKRTRITKRDLSTLPKTLTQKTTNNEKQVATVTEILQAEDTDETPSAKLDIESQALGDGTYVVRKVEVEELFDGKSVTVEKPEVIPERFRAEIQTVTEITNEEVSSLEEWDTIINEENMVLGEDDLSIRRQKVNNFVYAEQKTRRKKADPNDPKANKLEGSQTYVNGTKAIIKEQILSEENNDNLEPDSGFLVEQSKVTPLGGGKYLKETVEVNEYPELYSGEIDPIIQEYSLTKQTYIPYEDAVEQLFAKGGQTSDPVVKIQTVNGDRALKLEEFAPEGIDTFKTTSKTTVSLSLPPELKSIKVIWDEDRSDGYYLEGSESGDLSITDGTVSSSSSGNISGSAGATPILDIELVSTWASDVPATNYFFFTKTIEDLTVALNKVTKNVFKTWPYFKPKTFSVTAIGKNVTATVRSSRSQSKSVSEDREASSKADGNGQTGAVDTRIDISKIGPCLCRGIDITGDSERKVRASVSGTFQTFYDATAKVAPTSFAATEPPSIPTSGNYVISARAEPYKWGYYRVVATTINAADFYMGS